MVNLGMGIRQNKKSNVFNQEVHVYICHFKS